MSLVSVLISLFVLTVGGYLSYQAPFYWQPFSHQQYAFYVFSWGLTTLCFIPFTAIPQKVRALFTLNSFFSFLGGGLLAFYPLYRIMKELVDLKMQHRYAGLQGVQKLWTVFAFNFDQQGTTWFVWFVVSFCMVICATPFARKLLLDPLKTLCSEGGKKPLEKGPWQAGFMEKANVRILTSNKKGLPLGLVPSSWGRTGKLARFKENPDKGWLGGHHLVISGSRGGKGVSCVLPAILDHEGPVAVLDIKGELFSTTRRYRQSLGRKVVVLNPFNFVEKNRVHWNPLQYIRKDHFDIDVSVIVDGLIKPEVGQNSHFSRWAKNILRVGIGVLQETVPPEDFNLVELHKMFFGKGLLQTITSWKDQPELFEGKAASLAHTILSAGSDESGSFVTTLEGNLNWITFKDCQAFLQRNDVAMDDLLTNKLDVYCVVPLGMLSEVEGFLRLFSNIILGTVTRQSGVQNVKKPILLMLDEFTRLGRMEKLIDMMTMGAGAGLELFMVAQDRSSIEDVWGNSTGTVLGNTATTRVFNIGRSDEGTAAWVAALMGDRTVVTQSKNSSSTQKSDREGESFNQNKDKLLSAVDIQESSHQTLLCFMRGHKPLLLKRLISHKHPLYKTKLDKNPVLIKKG